MDLNTDYLSLGVAVLALIVAAVAVTNTNSLSNNVNSLDTLTDSDVRTIAGDLDDQQSSRVGEPLYTGSGLGYQIDFSNGERFYFAGDTGPMWQMENYIKERLQPTVAFFPAGDIYTSDMETAGWMASLVDAQVSIPMHYGTNPAMQSDPQPFIDEIQRLQDAGDTDTAAQVPPTGEWIDIRGIRTLWAGFGSFYFEDPEGFRIAVDPWVETNPDAPQAWKEDPANIPRVDMILITHGHLDHFTPSMIKKLQDMHNATVVAEWEMGAHMINNGFSNVVAVNKGGHIDKQQFKLSGASGGIERMPESMEIHPLATTHSSSPATALGQAFGLTVEGEVPQ